MKIRRRKFLHLAAGTVALLVVSQSAWAQAYPARPITMIVPASAGVQALADPAVRSHFISLGLEIFPPERQTPEALGALVKADAQKWWPIIKELGIKGE